MAILHDIFHYGRGGGGGLYLFLIFKMGFQKALGGHRFMKLLNEKNILMEAYLQTLVDIA